MSFAMRYILSITALIIQLTGIYLSLKKPVTNFFFEHWASSTRYAAAFPSYIFIGTAQACCRTRGVELIVGSLASTKRTCHDTKPVHAVPVAQPPYHNAHR